MRRPPRAFWASGGDIVGEDGLTISLDEAERRRRRHIGEAARAADSGEAGACAAALAAAAQLAQALREALQWRRAAA